MRIFMQTPNLPEHGSQPQTIGSIFWNKIIAQRFDFIEFCHNSAEKNRFSLHLLLQNLEVMEIVRNFAASKERQYVIYKRTNSNQQPF